MALFRCSSGSGSGGSAVDFANLEVAANPKYNTTYSFQIDNTPNTTYVILRYSTSHSKGEKVNINDSVYTIGVFGFDANGVFGGGVYSASITYSGNIVTWTVTPNSAYQYVTVCKMT